MTGGRGKISNRAIIGNPASVIRNASINAHIGMPNTSVYGATKAALLSLARTLSGELFARGIRVTAVSPGPIATPLYSKLGLSTADLPAVSESLKNQVPARRFGKPSEIASAVVFLASDESAFTVGSEFIVDGGQGSKDEGRQNTPVRIAGRDRDRRRPLSRPCRWNVRSLSAATVIDYRRSRFEDLAPSVDIVLDTVGGATGERSFAIVKPGGILVSVLSDQRPAPGAPADVGRPSSWSK